MSKVSRESAPDVTDHGPAEDRGAHFDGYAVIFTSIREDWDLAPLLKGLPGVSAAPTAPSRLLRLGTLPVVTAVFTLITAAYYTLVAVGNITDFGTNQQFVQHVFEMDTTFNDPDVTWRAIGSSLVQNVAYILIIVWEVLIALVLIWAFIAWVAALRAGRGYDRPRRLSTLGWTMVLLLFAGGFIVIGGEWFQMWQSQDWNGLDPALQNTIVVGLALILAHLPSRDWDTTVTGTPGAPGSATTPQDLRA